MSQIDSDGNRLRRVLQSAQLILVREKGIGLVKRLSHVCTRKEERHDARTERMNITAPPPRNPNARRNPYHQTAKLSGGLPDFASE